ncbi:MAG: 50S ribosomal protein L10 [Alphaproteobacteria bacterium]|nr:50S ribosomal protein L10 [Alphaproteobacteria bacterium]
MGEKAIKVKKQIVLELKDKMESSKGIIFYDYRGLSVLEVTELRNKFREVGVEYHVIKNSMLRRAADMLEIAGLDEYLAGPTAVAFGLTDPVAPAKVLVEFVKKVKKTEIKSGLLGHKVIDVKGIEALAELPSREQLLAQLAGTLNAPITGLARSLSGIICKLGYALNAVKEQKEA